MSGQWVLWWHLFVFWAWLLFVFGLPLGFGPVDVQTSARMHAARNLPITSHKLPILTTSELDWNRFWIFHYVACGTFKHYLTIIRYGMLLVHLPMKSFMESLLSNLNRRSIVRSGGEQCQQESKSSHHLTLPISMKTKTYDSCARHILVPPRLRAVLCKSCNKHQMQERALENDNL